MIPLSSLKCLSCTSTLGMELHEFRAPIESMVCFISEQARLELTSKRGRAKASVIKMPFVFFEAMVSLTRSAWRLPLHRLRQVKGGGRPAGPIAEHELVATDMGEIGRILGGTFMFGTTCVGPTGNFLSIVPPVTVKVTGKNYRGSARSARISFYSYGLTTGGEWDEPPNSPFADSPESHEVICAAILDNIRRMHEFNKLYRCQQLWQLCWRMVRQVGVGADARAGWRGPAEAGGRYVRLEGPRAEGSLHAPCVG